MCTANLNLNRGAIPKTDSHFPWAVLAAVVIMNKERKPKDASRGGGKERMCASLRWFNNVVFVGSCSVLFSVAMLV